MGMDEAFFQQAGCRPHVILSMLHRIKLDPNRPVEEVFSSSLLFLLFLFSFLSSLFRFNPLVYSSSIFHLVLSFLLFIHPFSSLRLVLVLFVFPSLLPRLDSVDPFLGGREGQRFEEVGNSDIHWRSLVLNAGCSASGSGGGILRFPWIY